MVKIYEVAHVDDELVAAFDRIVPQLSESNPPPSKQQLLGIVESDASTLLIARDKDGTILGTVTLVVFPTPTGMRAQIEDVVVDIAARGQGVGRLMSERALEISREAGASKVDLTSRPSREDANRLYQKMGFIKRKTNVYRHTFIEKSP